MEQSKKANSYQKKKAGDYIVLLNKVLGTGSFGCIYEAYHQLDPSKIFAVKTIDLSILMENSESSEIKERFKKIMEREIQILKLIKHKNIVEFIDFIITSRNLYIFLEKCNDGNLSEYAKKNKFTEKQVFLFLKEFLTGYNELMINNIIHRDLKPQNILINDGVFKIADFGYSRIVTDCKNSQMLTNDIGSPFYMAPEVYEKEIYSNKCDMWSLGIIIYELVFGYKPWKGTNIYDINVNIKKYPLEFNKNNDIFNIELNILIKFMLEIDPDKRLDWESLLQHKILKGI